MSIQVIAGLGNPGNAYESTRHNIGFRVIDAFGSELRAKWKLEKKFNALVAKISYAGGVLYLIKPQTYMNESGRALSAFAKYYKLSQQDFAVVYDEINLEVGRLKLAQKGSAGGHNGIQSILDHMGNGFLRYRIGVGGKPHPEADLKDHVLGKFTKEEQDQIEEQFKHYLNGLHLLLRGGVSQAMNQLNTKEKKDLT